MIELHSHVLPGIDDGTRDIPEALQLLTDYTNQGVTTIVCTPHLLPETFSSAATLVSWLDRCDSRITELSEAAKEHGIEVTLLAGAEISLSTSMLPYLQQPELATRFSLNKGSYILVELPHTLSGGLTTLEGMLFQIELSGYSPILAHPERTAHNPGVMAVLKKWVESGRILLQANAGHLVDDPRLDPQRRERYRRRQKITIELIRQNMIEFISSDAHDPVNRPCQHQLAYEKVARLFGETTAKHLLSDNPANVINNLALGGINQTD